MKQSSKKLLALMTAGMLCAGSLGALPAFAETEGESGKNDTIETAEAIDVNTEVTGNLATKNDVDYYRLDLAENSLLELNFQHDRTDKSYELWDYSIADSNGTTIHTWGISGTQTNFTTPQMGFAKGTYYLVVTSTINDAPDINYTISANSVADVTGTFETEYNDDIDTASTLPLNTPCIGNLYAKSDKDYYQLNLEEDSLLSLTFQHDKTDRSHELWDYSIADSNGTTIHTWGISGTQTNFTTPQMGFAKGTYYLVVTSTINDAPDINYTISANSVADVTGTFETEYNDDIDTASTLPLNTPCIGNLYAKSDKDYYQLNLEEDSLLSLTFQHDKTDRSHELWDYSIADSNGTTIHTWGISGTQTNFTTPQMGFAKGTYYLVVTSTINDAPDINYTISANSVADVTGTFETEYNDDIDTASTLPLNTPCIGNLYAKSDKDYYQLNLEEDSLLNLTFQHDKTDRSYALWNYTIADSKGTTIHTWEISGTQTNFTTPQMRFAKGTYYLVVTSTINDAPDANYTLTVNAKEITYTKGDANADGSIDSTDVFEMMYSCAKKAVGRTDDLLEGENFLAADIDENGTLDSTDIFYEMLYIASKGAGVPVDWDSIVK